MNNVEELAVEISRLDKAIIVAHSQLLFLDFFFGDELTISPDRADLPKEWHGQMVKSEKQRIMVCDRNNQVAYRISRKTGKTIILCAKFFMWSLWHAGQPPTDGLLHTPREHHLTNIRLRIERKIFSTPLFRMLITNINRSKGFIETATGITWFLRIEGRTGTGESMVGPSARYELGDEQDYSGWGAFNERQQATLPGAMRALCGVPRGVQGGPFWTLANRTDFNEGWSVFRGADGYNAFINPIYQSAQAKRKLEIDHGGKETQAYQTQVLGLDGAKVFSSFFVLPVAVTEFNYIQVTGSDVDDGVLLNELNVNWAPSEKYIIAADIGGSPAPTEIIISCWRDGAWIEIGRVHLTLSDSFQTAACLHQINLALPHPASLIVIDAHSHGAGVYDWLHRNEAWAIYDYNKKVIDAEFASYVEDTRKMVHPVCKHVVRSTDMGWYCDACGVPIFRREDLESARVQAKQWAFTALKDCFASGQRWLTEQGQKLDHPPIVLNSADEQLLLALEGTTEKETAQGLTQWDAPSRHLVDMMLCLTVGVNRLADLGHETDAPGWLDELGWTGGEGDGLLLPWEVANVQMPILR